MAGGAGFGVNAKNTSVSNFHRQQSVTFPTVKTVMSCLSACAVHQVGPVPPLESSASKGDGTFYNYQRVPRAVPPMKILLTRCE